MHNVVVTTLAITIPFEAFSFILNKINVYLPPKQSIIKSRFKDEVINMEMFLWAVGSLATIKIGEFVAGTLSRFL